MFVCRTHAEIMAMVGLCDGLIPELTVSRSIECIVVRTGGGARDPTYGVNGATQNPHLKGDPRPPHSP